MGTEEPSIRVKAMLIAPNADRSAHAVSLNGGSRENPAGYHRLIGGSIEFGETHEEAIAREVDEELGARVRELRYLGVVENLFHLDGSPGHEIVFLCSGRLDPEPAPEGATLTEMDGTVVPVVWRLVADAGEQLPLYPAAARDWIPLLVAGGDASPVATSGGVSGE